MARQKHLRDAAQRTTLLSPKLLQNAAQTGDNTQWRSAGLPVRIELVAQHTQIPSGWVLITGQLHGRRQDSAAKLLTEGAGEACRSFDIPVTDKGNIRELVCLPTGVLKLVLETARSPGEFGLGEISLIPVGYFRRVAIVFARIAPFFFRYSLGKRNDTELRAYTLLRDPYEAYRIAGRFKTHPPELSYRRWIRKFDTLTRRDRRLMRRHARRWRRLPRFEIVIFSGNSSESGLTRTLDSIDRQLYNRFRATLLVPSQTAMDNTLLHLPQRAGVLRQSSDSDLADLFNSRGTCDRGTTWVVFLKAGTVLAEHALYWLASEAVHHEGASLIYSDHDFLDSDGTRVNPAFKPDWSPELLRSTNYIGDAVAMRTDVFVDAGSLVPADIVEPDNHDLLLRVTENLENEEIRHVPAALWHLPYVEARQTVQSTPQAPCPVSAHLARLGVAATVERSTSSHYRVRYALPPNPPIVSIIVPTRDALTHLKACIESVLVRSTYRDFELIVVDNQSKNPKTLAYLADLSEEPHIRVLRYDRPFNYSAINNFAARIASSEVLCLLNNDTEVITPDWMEIMLGHLIQPNIGVVGAKLYYSDGRVQHAGDTVGPGGCADHLHSLIERDATGYCDRAILAQDLSSVTGACLMTWRRLFTKLGGLDARELPVAFNDVDYCLRVREAGHRIVWTPHAELYHYESTSRGSDDTSRENERAKREIAYMRGRWKHLMRHDPFYNPNLNYARPDFSLSRAPRVKKPW